MATDSYTNIMEYKISEVLWKYMSPCLMVVGLVGNILVFVVLSKSSMRQTTTSLYLRFMSVFDGLVLYTGLMRNWIIHLIDYDVREYSPAVCKIHMWASYWTTYCSGWLLVSVTLERCFSVWFPHKVKMVCTKRKSYLIIIIIILVMMTLSGHYLYGRGDYVETIDNDTIIFPCDNIYDDYDEFEIFLWPWVDFCIYGLFPSTILTICNISIIYKVVSSSRHILHNDSSSGTSIQSRSVSSRRNQASSLTAMLLITSFTYVVCTTPFCIYMIYINTLDFDKYDRPQEWADTELVWLVVNMLQYSNNCINFILYCVSGKRFRDQLCALCSRRARRHPEIYSLRISSAGNNTRSSNADSSF